MHDEKTGSKKSLQSLYHLSIIILVLQTQIKASDILFSRHFTSKCGIYYLQANIFLNTYTAIVLFNFNIFQGFFFVV